MLSSAPSSKHASDPLLLVVLPGCNLQHCATSAASKLPHGPKVQVQAYILFFSFSRNCSRTDSLAVNAELAAQNVMPCMVSGIRKGDSRAVLPSISRFWHFLNIGGPRVGHTRSEAFCSSDCNAAGCTTARQCKQQRSQVAWVQHQAC